MSRATESEHTPQRAAGPGAEHAPDLDAEHDPDVSRRASMSGMRKIAAELLDAPRTSAAPAGGARSAGKLAGATAEQQAEQHAKAESRSVDAVSTALKLATARINEHYLQMQTLLAAPLSEAGVQPHLDSMFGRFEEVLHDLKRLEGELSTQDPAEATSLQREVVLLGGAVARFCDIWKGRVRTHARQHGDAAKFERANPYELEQQIFGGIYKKVGLDSKEFKYDWSGAEVSELQGEAMQQTLDAALECARSVRMGMGTGKPEILQKDLSRMIWHFKEIDSILAKDTTGKLKRQLASQIGAALQAAHAVRDEVSGHPGLAELMSKAYLSQTLQNIRAQVRGR